MNLREYTTKLLKEKEELVEEVRRSGSSMAVGLAIGIGLVLADFFLLAKWVAWQQWGLLGFVVILGVGITITVRTWYVWSWNVFIVTTQRIVSIAQRGWFHRTVSEATYEKIQDVRYTVNGMWQTMFHVGTIIVQTAGGSTTLELNGIKHPVELQQLITDIQREAAEANDGDHDPAELIAAVSKLQQEHPELWNRLRKSKGKDHGA